MVRAEEESILEGAVVTFDTPTKDPNVLVHGSFKSVADAAYSSNKREFQIELATKKAFQTVFISASSYSQ